MNQGNNRHYFCAAKVGKDVKFFVRRLKDQLIAGPHQIDRKATKRHIQEQALETDTTIQPKKIKNDRNAHPCTG